MQGALQIVPGSVKGRRMASKMQWQNVKSVGCRGVASTGGRCQELLSTGLVGEKLAQLGLGELGPVCATMFSLYSGGIVTNINDVLNSVQ